MNNAQRAVLPSIWGQHTSAKIAPRVLKDRIVTIVRNAPEQWSERLQALRFQNMQGAWVKNGVLSEGQYRFLSTEINVVGFRPEWLKVIPVAEQAKKDFEERRSVPFDLQDALLELWAYQRKSLVIALACADPSNLKKEASFTDFASMDDSELWSLVEMGLGGAQSATTETLLKMAYQRLKIQGKAGKAAEHFMQTRKWLATADQEASADLTQATEALEAPKAILIRAGDSLVWEQTSWNKNERIQTEHFGQVASDFREGDSGIWVYENAPVFVQGYPAIAPLWVGAETILKSPSLTKDLDFEKKAQQAEEFFQIELIKKSAGADDVSQENEAVETLAKPSPGYLSQQIEIAKKRVSALDFGQWLPQENSSNSQAQNDQGMLSSDTLALLGHLGMYKEAFMDVEGYSRATLLRYYEAFVNDLLAAHEKDSVLDNSEFDVSSEFVQSLKALDSARTESLLLLLESLDQALEGLPLEWRWDHTQTRPFSRSPLREKELPKFSFWLQAEPRKMEAEVYPAYQDDLIRARLDIRSGEKHRIKHLKELSFENSSTLSVEEFKNALLGVLNDLGQNLAYERSRIQRDEQIIKALAPSQLVNPLFEQPIVLWERYCTDARAEKGSTRVSLSYLSSAQSAEILQERVAFIQNFEQLSFFSDVPRLDHEKRTDVYLGDEQASLRLYPVFCDDSSSAFDRQKNPTFNVDEALKDWRAHCAAQTLKLEKGEQLYFDGAGSTAHLQDRMSGRNNIFGGVIHLEVSNLELLKELADQPGLEGVVFYLSREGFKKSINDPSVVLGKIPEPQLFIENFDLLLVTAKKLLQLKRSPFVKNNPEALKAIELNANQYIDFSFQEKVDQFSQAMKRKLLPVLENIYQQPDILEKIDTLLVGALSLNMPSLKIEYFTSGLSSIRNDIVEKMGTTVSILVTPKALRWNTFTFNDEDLSESRAAFLGKKSAALKQRYRGKVVSIDILEAFAANFVKELQSNFPNKGQFLLEAGLFDEHADQEEDQEKEETIYGHQDTGVVKGFSRKELAGWSSERALKEFARMTPEQIEKYVKKENFFPRKSFKELRDLGADPVCALLYDKLWLTLPNEPKSVCEKHIRWFSEVIQGYQELLNKSLEHHLICVQENNQLPEKRFRLFNAEVFAKAKQMYQGSENACMHANKKIRGTDIRLFNHYYSNYEIFRNEFRFFGNRESSMKTTWDDLIKERKATTHQKASQVARGEILRIGEDYRKGRDIDGDDFLKTFGFSGIEYGEWTQQKERGAHLNLSFDSLMDLANTLGVPPMALSFGGRLGLCIGSRGIGGKNPANAHFEPANMAINLTRMRGAGSLAHEYFHALSAHLGYESSGSVKSLDDMVASPMLSENFQYRTPDPAALRPELMKAFYDLMVSIMKKPSEGQSAQEISAYKEDNDMLLAAKELDKKRSALYWSTPAEMFARAMEAWFKDRLELKGHRNDYLVKSSRYGLEQGVEGGSALYPCSDHLKRIQPFAECFMQTLTTEMRSVQHPYLGLVEMPYLHCDLPAVEQFSPEKLEAFARMEIKSLFGRYAPKLVLVNEGLPPGLYQAASNVITLNASCADRSTFYHEAWHAAHEVLLHKDERQLLGEVFHPESPLGQKVIEALREKGLTKLVEKGLPSEEIQAYAFQMWTQGEFVFNANEKHTTESSKSFTKVRSFIDELSDIESIVGAEKVERLFKSLLNGSLAKRMEAQQAQKAINQNINSFEKPLEELGEESTPDYLDEQEMLFDDSSNQETVSHAPRMGFR